MKTHMSNTQAKLLQNDILGHTQFINHQKVLHSQIKPRVDNKRKQQVKMMKNNKKQLLNNPKQQVNSLFYKLHKKPYNSQLDNKQPLNYQNCKKILNSKLKMNKKEQYIQSEHQRELRSILHRKNNCKSMQQRKKQKTDPITNPTYFLRNQQAKSVSITPFCKKVIAMNQPKITNKQTYQINHTFSSQFHEDLPKTSSYGTGVPNYSKTRPISAQPSRTRHGKQQTSADLPQCTFPSILNHIINNKIYKQTDIKVLYVRLCYKYGDDKVDQVWQSLMNQLQS